MSANFKPNPVTPIEHSENVQFQMENVDGWLSINDEIGAYIKAKCAVEAATALVECLRKSLQSKGIGV